MFRENSILDLYMNLHMAKSLSSFYILDINLLSNVLLTNNFSHLVGCLAVLERNCDCRDRIKISQDGEIGKLVLTQPPG